MKRLLAALALCLILCSPALACDEDVCRDDVGLLAWMQPYIAGAGVSGGSAAACVVYESTYFDKAAHADEYFGYSSTYSQRGRSSFSPTSGTKHICQIDVVLTATGTISDRNYFCRITLKSGHNLSTVLGTSEAVIGVNSWSGSTVSFVFSTPVAVTSGTDYAIVFRTDGAASTSNYASLSVANDAVQTDGTMLYTWNATTGVQDYAISHDPRIKIYVND